MYIYVAAYIRTGVLVGEGKCEGVGLAEGRALRADAAAALRLAEVDHVQGEGKVLVVLHGVSPQQLRHLSGPDTKFTDLPGSPPPSARGGRIFDEVLVRWGVGGFCGVPRRLFLR